MRRTAIVKMSGTGNDFLMVDNRQELLREEELPLLARAACPRRTSAGADGVILIEKAGRDDCDFRMRIINADGSEAEMCGNGSRCAAVFAVEIGAAGREQVIETLAGTLRATVGEDNRFARVRLSPPSELVAYPALDLGEEKADVWWIDTGVPHAVRFVDDSAAVDIEKAGPLLRRHRSFAPRGANADFVQLLGNNEIAVRTFERGVEGETLACGTGAAACAITAGLIHGYDSPVRVRVASGDILTIHFKKEDAAHASEPWLEGAVQKVYIGEFLWETAEETAVPQ